MTRLFVIVAGLVCILACNQKTGTTTIKEDSTASANTIPETDTNRYEIFMGDTILLPTGFSLDSTSKFDSLRNVEITLLIPRYNGNAPFNKPVAEYLNSRLKSFMSELDTTQMEDPSLLQTTHSSFWVKPVSVFKDDIVVSYCFFISYYYAGSPHPMSEYYSINYDLTLNKEISFSDYFTVPSTRDTQVVRGIINKAIDRENIGVENLQQMDFNIEQNCIGFNFDNYEIAGYAEGIIRAKVLKGTLQQYVQGKYR